jgi:phosphate/sulfate permease
VRPSEWPLWKKALAVAITTGGVWAVYAATYAFAEALPPAGQWALLIVGLVTCVGLWLLGKAIERRRH